MTRLGAACPRLARPATVGRTDARPAPRGAHLGDLLVLALQRRRRGVHLAVVAAVVAAGCGGAVRARGVVARARGRTAWPLAPARGPGVLSAAVLRARGVVDEPLDAVGAHPLVQAAVDCATEVGGCERGARVAAMAEG